MKIKSSMLLNIILLTIISASFFLVNTTASNYETTSTHEYDPHLDYDMDGDIDLYDAVYLLTRYGTKGTPVNWTKLLDDVDELRGRVEALENQTGWLPAPAYDSGWVSLTPASWLTLEHELGTTEVLVYMTANTSLGDYGLNQAFYGGFFWNMTFNHGALWCKLNNNNISLIRYQGDYHWEQVRVRMWRIQEP
jgi:hypothetical protein